MKYLLVFLLLVSICLNAPASDEVTMLEVPYSDHHWYSGYLDFPTGSFHYVFFESQHDPDNDPLVLWLNGGPGCSSLIGMVYQNGPFVFKENSTNLEKNPYSWNNNANLLYIESPGGVGFSVDKRGLKNDDGTVAEDNYLALLAFFAKFPNLKKNDLYLTGQSYAGIYIPYLAKEILRRNSLQERTMTMNLKGIMIGNACTDPRECYEPGNDIDLGIYQYEFLFLHGFITEKQFNMLKGTCWLGYHSAECSEVRAPIDKRFYASKTSMLNIYAQCMNQPVQFSNQKTVLLRDGLRYTVGDNAVSCEDSIGIHDFFNKPLNQLQLHVNFQNFQECSDDVANGYSMFANASYWIYPLLIKENLRVWIYEGDVDCSVPITGTLMWITKLKEEFGLPVIEPWRQWWVKGLHKHEDQVAGMTWKLKGFTFASIRGAGHLVPKDKRAEAAVLLSSFLSGSELPTKSD